MRNRLATENVEVETPILNTLFDEPSAYWLIEEGKMPERLRGRRPAGYWYRSPKAPDGDEHAVRGEWRELALVNLVRGRMAEWCQAGRPGVTRTTRELVEYWSREGRSTRLFFAQRGAAEAIIFLSEARADFRQGISVSPDEPGDGRKAFRRLACKMATGSGKTTVMAMLAAWSILNKVNDRSDRRFSDVVLVACPNVTIRSRLGELDPRNGEPSLYRTRDLVPERLMPDLTQGRVLVTNWHVFEPQGSGVGGTGARVVKTGRATPTRETFVVAGNTTSFHGRKSIAPAMLDARVAQGELRILEDKTDNNGRRTVSVTGTAYVESDTGLVKIPQLAVRDTTGADIPGYFNIWRWILPKLTAADRGGKKANPKPEAILKYTHTPIAMLGGLWDQLRREWAERHAMLAPLLYPLSRQHRRRCDARPRRRCSR